MFRGVNDAKILIDEQAWRRIALDHFLVQGAVARRGLQAQARHVEDVGAAHRLRKHRQPRLGRRHVAAPIQAALLVLRLEQRAAVNQLGWAEQQQSFRMKRIVEEIDDVALQFALQIDQEIAADDQVETREGRIAQNIMLGEHHDFPHLLADAIAVVLFGEEPSQPLRPNFAFDGVGIETLAGAAQRRLMQIACENLDARRVRHAPRLFQKQHRDAVGLFTGGAADRPGADGVGGSFFCEEPRDDFLFEIVVGVCVSKELSDRDQKLFRQKMCFVRAAAQILQIVREQFLLMQLHAAANAAQHGRMFVFGKIHIRARTHLRQYALQKLPILDRRLIRGFRDFDARPRARKTHDARRDVFDRQDAVDKAGRDGVLRHGLELQLIRVLRDRQPALLLDLADPESSVGAVPDKMTPTQRSWWVTASVSRK